MFELLTYKVSVAHPHKAVSKVHGLVLQHVHSDFFILGLSTCFHQSLELRFKRTKLLN